MVRFLADLGLSMGHGKLGVDGTVGEGWATGRSIVPGERGKRVAFQHVWHQVREPLACIASLAKHYPRSRWSRFGPYVHLPRDPIARSMAYYLRWNEIAERRAQWRYRIEDIAPGSDVFIEMCRRLGLNNPPFPDVPTDTHAAREPLRLLWAALESADATLASAIREMAERYGYAQL